MTKRVIIDLPAVADPRSDQLCQIPHFTGARATGKRVYATTLSSDLEVARAVHSVVPEIREISIDQRPVFLYNGIEHELPEETQQFRIVVREHGKPNLKKYVLENVVVLGEQAKRETVAGLDLQYPPETHSIDVRKI